MTPPFDGPCMHEALFDDSFLKDTGVTTLDFAKAMIDEGYHPMTMYFPLVVHGAMLIEPTETEFASSMERTCSLRCVKASAAKSFVRPRFLQCGGESPSELRPRGARVSSSSDTSTLSPPFTPAALRCSCASGSMNLPPMKNTGAAVGVALPA
jgi:hypothetical protein